MKKPKGQRTPQHTPERGAAASDFLVVGIGASAGGIEALQAFFRQVQPDSGAAYVVILHLSPDHDSQLAAVLQTVSEIPVAQVTSRVKIEPNQVYVIPPNRHLVMEDGHIAVLSNTLMEERRAPVDIFFRTLAETHRARAVGVILSGTGANGSMGLKRIKEQGGAVFVQNPREALYNEMARNAIATAMVDDVLGVELIPARILAYRDTLAQAHIEDEPEDRVAEDQQALRELFTQLRLRTGHDFSAYKRATLMRRIERRMAVHGLSALPAYATFANEHPEETQALLKDLLISVTNFFRDHTPFIALEEEVLPAIFENKSAEDQVRIWVAGCATGEEAYSIAMLCAERTLGMVDAPKVQLFATDIDEAAIAAARDGYYTLNDAADVSAERLSQFFTREGEGYRIRREIRETILFANHNFLKDPPFSRIDLVTCRNVLIYLNRPAQERVMETFHFALKAGGFMLLGTSESVDTANDLFKLYDREQHIYQSRITANLRAIVVPETVPQLRAIQPAQPAETKVHSVSHINQSELHLQLVEQYAPPSLVVDPDFDVTHMSPRAGRYLEFTGGEPTKAVLKLVQNELRSELRNGLYQAAQKGVPVNSEAIAVRTKDGVEHIRIHIRPVAGEDTGTKGHLLVVFEPAIGGDTHREPVAYTSDESATRQLEEEVMRLRAQLRASNEQHEFQAEELKAGNEELQAMNEELRSATEELETSKEELQSINEELSTVNQELKVKVEESNLISSNLQNLINSTDIGTIFLDRSFRVVLFTPAVCSVFNLIPADHGRPLSDITSKLQDDTLLEDAAKVLERLQMIEREAQSNDGRTFLVRLAPYRTEEDRIQGVVISLVDISERKRSEAAVASAAVRDAFLIRLADAMRAGPDAGAMATAALHLLAEHLHLDRAYIARIQGPGLPVDIIAEHGRPDLAPMPAQLRPADFPEGFQKAAEGIFVVTDIWSERTLAAPDRESLNAMALTAFLIAPLHRGAEGMMWALVAGSRSPRSWTDSEVVLVKETAERIWGTMERANAEAALRESEERRAFMLRLSDAIQPLSDPAAVQMNACRLLGEQLQVDRAYFVEARIAERITVVRQDYVRGELFSLAGTYPLSDFDWTLKVYGQGRPVVIPDVWTSDVVPEDAKAASAAAHVSWIAIPLVREGEVAGALCVADIRPRAWTAAEVDIAHETAERLWAVVERANAEAALRESEERQTFLLKLSDALRPYANPADVEAVAARATMEYFGADRCYYCEIRDDECLIRRDVARGGLPSVAGTYRLANFPLFKKVIDAGRPFTVDNVQTTDLVDDELRQLCISLQVIAFNDVPVIKEGKATGILCLVQSTPRAWSPAESALLTETAERIWSAVERALAEEALRASEERYRTLFNSIDEGFCTIEVLFDDSGRAFDYAFLETNPAFMRQTGFAHFEGKTMRQLAPGHEEFWYETYGRIAITGEPARFEHEAAALGRYYDVYAFRIGEPGERRVAVIFSDIAERRLTQEALRITEERYRVALQSAEMGTWDWDVTNDRIDWNDQHFMLLGLQPRDEQLNAAFFLGFVHPDDAGFVTAELKRSVADNGAYRAEFRIVQADGGAVRWMSGFGRVVAIDDAGHASRMVGVMYDITDRKLLEQQKEQFIGIASHELRTPVTSIKAYGEILQMIFERVGDEKSVALMRKMDSQVDRLITLINALLDSTRIAEGKLHMQKTDFAIDKLIRDTAETMQHVAGAQRIELALNAAAELHGDEDRIRQVLVNLISNAIKYAPGTERIIVQSFSNRQEVTVCVQDFGIGIDEAKQHQVFERFFRTDEDSAVSGLGLGLFISATIVREHGGTLSVRSNKGEGATFCFTLPLGR